MLAEENDLMCRVEPGYPMHDAFKRYWLVAGLSEDHPAADSAPRRSTMLGEDYVLFRDSEGKMACLREQCCHRGASLCLGRVEEGGIRCLYHGWKFARDGSVLDMPNAADARFKERYRQPSYPVHELGGMVWVYLGPRDEAPPPPDYFWLHLPGDCYFLAPTVYEANFAQVVDGGADSSHLTILHQDALARNYFDLDPTSRKRILADAAPRFEVLPTEFGQFSTAIRKSRRPDGTEVETCRSSAFIAPSTVLVTPGSPDGGTWAVNIPISSTRTISYIGVFDRKFPLDTPEKKMEARRFMGIDPESLQRLGLSRESTGKTEKFSRANNWAQDRARMRSGERFTGLPLFIPEDVAMAESQGAIYDRTQENLVPADLPIVRIRRILVEMVKDVQAGRKPIGLRGPVDTSKIYCTEAAMDGKHTWVELLVPPQFQPQRAQEIVSKLESIA